MKKLFLLFFVVCATVSVNAQLYVGGALSAWMSETKTAETVTVKFLPELGFSISNRWAFGSVLGYTRKGVDGEITSETFEFTPYARFFFYRTELVRLFVESGFSIYSNKTGKADPEVTLSTGFKPGVSFDLSERVSLVAKFGFLGYRQYSEDHYDFGFSAEGNGLSLGVFYTF